MGQEGNSLEFCHLFTENDIKYRVPYTKSVVLMAPFVAITRDHSCPPIS